MSRYRQILPFVAVAVLVSVVLVLGTGDDRPSPTPAPTPPPGRGAAPTRSAAEGDGVHLALGNPSGAATRPDQPNNYLIVRPQYALAYDRDRGTPVWASWHLTRRHLGDVERYAGQFIPDTSLPSGWYQVQHRDYTGSGYDRGHIVPSADRTARPADNEATFILSNIVPQAPENNQGPWAELEDYIRSRVRDGDEAYVIAGPQGDAGTIAEGRVTVPAVVWKVALVLPAGSDDLSRISGGTEVIAVLMPNDATVEGQPWESYATSVGCIEELTGLDLLSALPDPVEGALAGAGCGSGGSARAAGVRIAGVEYSPSGDDVAGEYVLLQNTAAQPVMLTGWTLEDSAGTSYTFPVFTLAARAEVRVWVRAGQDTRGDLYWGRTQAVWNNSGDTAMLRDATGAEVARFTYP